MTVVIGLTGPIGCGKSTVAGWLAELGATVIDADLVARAVVEPGQAPLAAVRREFGHAILSATGELDRAALGRIVFTDAAALERLERIVHPAVRRVILAELADARRREAPSVVVEAIKLVEGGLADLCTEVWLISCAPAEQARRLAGRGVGPADAAARIGAQAGLIERAAGRASRVIDSSGTPTDTRALVDAAYAEALHHAVGGTGGA